MEHLDLDVGIPPQKPNDLSTIQPVDMTSPMGAQKIPHQPITPGLAVNTSNGGQKTAGSNYMMVNHNQRQSPMNKQHENNFMIGTSGKGGYQKNGSLGPQSNGGFKNFRATQGGFNHSGMP